MTEKQKAIEQEAWKTWEEDQTTNPNPVNPHAYVYGFIAGRSAAEKEIAELKELLEECEEYFDSRADADHKGENFVPNKEMKLLDAIQKQLNS